MGLHNRDPVALGNAREAGIAKALADPDKTNKGFKLIWLGCGTNDAAINGALPCPQKGLFKYSGCTLP